MIHKDTQGSVSHWLVAAKQQVDPSGADLLWRRFGVKLVRLARHQLRGISDPSYEAEDLALSTLHEFYHRILNGRT
jgi:hypothetical protein